MSANPLPHPSDELLTRKEAAHLLGVEPNTLARWLSCGRGNNGEDRGPACVRGEYGMVLYRRSDVLAWARERGLWTAARSGRPSLGRSGRPPLGRPALGQHAARRPSPDESATERQAPPQAAPPAIQAPNGQLQARLDRNQAELGRNQAELERVKAELEKSQADADQLRLELEKSQAGGEAESRGEELRQAEQIMLHCLEKHLRSSTPLMVSKVVQDGEAIERDYIVSAGGGRSKLWAVACPECGHHVGSGKEYLGLTGGLAGEYTCGKCAARLLVAETSSPYVLPSGRATAVPTVSVLSLKPAKREAK